MNKPSVFVCSGKSCSNNKAWRKLCDHLDSYAHVNEVGCQKICDGPVCGAIVHGHLEWFEDVAGPTVRDDLEALLTKGKSSGRLSKRLVRKRRNRLR